MFLAAPHKDINKSHELSCWWSDWYKYTTCKDTGSVIYGDRVHIRPSTNPCSSSFVQWATLLPLFGDKTVALVGPFQFEPINASNRVKQKVHHNEWTQLI